MRIRIPDARRLVTRYFSVLSIGLFLLGACETPASKGTAINRKGSIPSAGASSSKKGATVPVKAPFQSNALITLADGRVFEVGEFKFYSEVEEFPGGYYIPETGALDWNGYIVQGPIWKLFSFGEIQELGLRDAFEPSWMTADLTLIDGTHLQGRMPYSYMRIWERMGHIRLTAYTELLGRSAVLVVPLHNVIRIKRTGLLGGKPQFLFSYKSEPKGERAEATITSPGLRLIWKEWTPNKLYEYAVGVGLPLPVRSGGIEVEVMVGEIDTVIPMPGGSRTFRITMKNGDSVNAELPPRIFGKCENGDVIFTELLQNGRPTIKKIVIR